MKIPRWLSPKTNPALYSALLGLAYAIWQGELAASANGPLTWQRVGHVAAGVVWAAVSAWVRGKVTPVADPKDGNGRPLMGGLLPFISPLDEAERRRAEDLRLTHAPGSPSFYPYPGETPAAHTGPSGSTVTYKTDPPGSRTSTGTAP